jgi:hypothetical protein
MKLLYLDVFEPVYSHIDFQFVYLIIHSGTSDFDFKAF